MRTVAVVYSGGRHWGGIETYLGNLFRLHDPDRMRLLLLSMGDWALTEELKRQGLQEDVRILSDRRVSLKTLLGIGRHVRAEDVDLVVSQGVVANVYARASALVTRVPHLAVVHSDIKLDYPRATVRCVYQILDRLLRPVTKTYVAVSRYLMERLVASGVRPDRVHVVYNGVDTTTGGQLPSGEVAAEGSSSGTSEVRLASAGRLHRVKNYDSLVRAMSLLPDSVLLTVWGEGEERSDLETLVGRLGLAGRVRFPGESENMGQVLRDADIYLQPSWSEGCSFAVAEAMLQGKPTVVTPFGGLPEQVRDRVTGIVATDGSPEELARAIEVLICDRSLAARLGVAGKEAAEEMYCMDKWLAETTGALCEAARPGGPCR